MEQRTEDAVTIGWFMLACGSIHNVYRINTHDIVIMDSESCPY